MASHVYHEIYLHINWHTKDDLPLLAGRTEEAVHDFLRTRCRATDGVYFHGVGGTETHVHLVVNVEPHVNTSDVVGDLKGSCSHEVNKLKRHKAVEWQRGFGVVSFGKNNLRWVLDYVANQKEHHAHGATKGRLEKAGSPAEAG